MKSSTLLRISSIVTALFALGHSAGAPWTPVQDPPERALIDSMKSLHFAVMGVQRSYWDFYFGFGVSGSIYVFALAILIWQIASLAKTDPKRARPMVLTMLAVFVAVAVVTLQYFFIIPVVMSSVLCVLLAWAWFQARREL
jgi:cellulose synthase/poly-beta-1,6-N-acetylglucosamine synthase-like glycosyltransferase